MTSSGEGKFRTEQEAFWAGQFGSDYIARNRGDLMIAANTDFFAKALRAAQPFASCIEFGANIGGNIEALGRLFPALECHAIEINPDAAGQLARLIPAERIFRQSILDFVPERTWDLVLIKGVLIHIAPDALPDVYDKLVAAAGRYLLVAEYYNPSPVEIPYRGHAGKLFKRDFAGEILDRHPRMRLVDYGFAYRRDPKFPQDDITWFLLERPGG